jgi:hypothetical protein
MGIGVRDGGAGGGGSCPPKRITKSKSRANVQHKSGEEWEIKKPKSPQFVGQTKAVGQYSLHSRAILAYYKKNWDKNMVNLVMYGKVFDVPKNFLGPEKFLDP